MIPCAISGSRPRPRSLVHVVVIIIRIVAVDGLVGVIGVIAHHHVLSPRRGAGRELLQGLIGSAAPLALCAHTLVPAGFVSSQEPLDRVLEPGSGTSRVLLLLLLLGLLGLWLVRALLVSHVCIADDGDRSGLRLLHLLLRCAPSPRWLILCAVAQNAKDPAVVSPLQCLPESRSLAAPSLRPRIPLRLGRLQYENK